MKIPISIKLTALYATILSFILLLISFVTFLGLYYVLYTQAVDDIRLSAYNVTNYLTADKPASRELLRQNLLVPGVFLRILDEQQNVLLDSAPADEQGKKEKDEDDINPFNRFSLKNEEAPLHIVKIGHAHYYYLQQESRQNDRVYQLYFMKDMREQIKFLKMLAKGMLAANGIGLLIAVFSGMFISRRILRPLRDITRTAKEIEITDLGRRLPALNSHDELSELVNTFNHMLTRLQAGFDQQRRFVSDASHELRTPLTVISGYVNMLDRWGKDDPAALEEGLEAIKSEAASMHRLIEKLLFLARTDQSRQYVQKAPLKIAALLDEVFQETKLIAPQHTVELTRNDDKEIVADQGLIKQMLRAFLENSIKYTPAGGKIELSSIIVGRHLEISIQDNGIGIPTDEQDRIFERFYRVDKSRAKDSGGTGLGLSIAKWIADQHGSSIQLQSEAGQGTRISVRLALK